jgi:pantetheine-phosphate adenylyltransferase
MDKIGFSGTLDPITNGHMWVIGEARSLADEVIVFLSENTLKKPQFSAEERKRIIQSSTAERGWGNVHVMIVRGDYTARAAKKAGVDYLIRGIRNTADFDYENLIQQTNVDVLHGAKSIFVMPPRDLGSVSSSFVRALQGPVGWHWNMKKFVPGPAYEAWVSDWLRQEWETLWQYQQADAAATANADHWFAQLVGPDAYGNTERHYHNLDHLVHGLTEIRVWAANNDCDQSDIDILKKAFWFHDAVYQQDKSGGQSAIQADIQSDEDASAALWLGSGLDAATAAQQSEASAQLIRATSHFQQPLITHRLKDLMLGVDLAILGQDEHIYDFYAQAIRDEYSHVPEPTYREHRCKALRHFLQQGQANQLYADAYFAAQYNEQAMQNMAREIVQLSAG